MRISARAAQAVAAVTVLAMLPGLALGIRYNLDHDHDIENVVKVREHEPGTLITGWAWKITDGKRHQVIGPASDVLERLLTVPDPSGRYTDLLLRGIVGNGGFPESLWRWNGVRATQLWTSWSPQIANTPVPHGTFLFDEGWLGEWAPKFVPAQTANGGPVPAKVLKKYAVGPCFGCAPTGTVTVTWTWSAHASRYVYSGESGSP